MEPVRQASGPSGRGNAGAGTRAGRRGRGLPLQLSGVPRGVLRRALKIRAVPSNVNYRYGSDELWSLLENSRGEGPLLRCRAPRQRHVGRGRSNGPPLLVEVAGGGRVTGSRRPRVRGAARGSRAGSANRCAMTTTCSCRTRVEPLACPRAVLFNIGQSLGNSFWFRDLFVGETTEHLDAVDFAVQEAETPVVTERDSWPRRSCTAPASSSHHFRRSPPVALSRRW